MDIKKLFVLNGGDDFTYIVGSEGVSKITYHLTRNHKYYEVAYETGKIVEVYSPNVIVVKEVA